MEQVRKRFRKNENSNGRAESSNTNLSNEDLELIQIIPTLVSEIFLEELRNVRLLKTCRLICKSWNIAASKSLRACSVVSLKENSPTLKDFVELLQNREIRSFQHFPSPFQNFHVEGTSFTDPTFINLVFNPSIICTSLTVVLPDKDCMDLDQSQLSLFLAANKDSITDLVITGKDNPRFKLNEASVNNAIRLTSLKSFQFSDQCRQCSHIQFLQNIMRMCRPTCLHLNIRDCDLLPILLLQDQVTHIIDLHLFCVKISKNVLTHLANTGLQLRSLSVFENDSDEYLQEWYSFLESVSPSLIDFQTNLVIRNERFPKLREIHIQNYHDLSEFTPNNFPSLTKFIFDIQLRILLCCKNCEVPHMGVQYVGIEAQDMPSVEGEEHEVFMLLTFVSRQFPNLTSLDISVPYFQSSTLTDIWKEFPSLKTLKLDGDCDFFSFAGFTTSSLNCDVPFEMIPRRVSILDFKNLEIVKFGPKFRVSRDMIRHCLPRVCKLKQIELHWMSSYKNSFLSARLFRKFVGHLEKIVISGAGCYGDAALELSILLPNVVLMR